MLQINRAYNENDVILMKAKISIILKLFLNSEIPPKLRVRAAAAPLWPGAEEHFPHKNPESSLPGTAWVSQMSFP